MFKLQDTFVFRTGRYTIIEHVDSRITHSTVIIYVFIYFVKGKPKNRYCNTVQLASNK